MGYEKKEIEEKIIDAGTNKLYASEIVNYKGYFKGTKERYTEYIAKYLLDHPDFFKDIKIIGRDKYKTGEHVRPVDFSKRPTKFPNNKGNREEEWIAKQIFDSQYINGLGEIVDYQTPLKVPRAGEANLGLGKIDLLGYKKKNSLLFLILNLPK